MQMHTALRFGVHLPFRDVPEESAAKLVVGHYEFEYGGSTYSSLRSPTFTGTWRSPDLDEFRADLCLLNIDVLVKDEEHSKYRTDEKISKIIGDINDYAREAYNAFGRPQLSFWITVTTMRVSDSG